jgi:two-component system, OmpR family, sensor histidine kinase CiaH
MKGLQFKSEFFNARIKLTIYYMVGLSVIIGLFTVLTLNARVSSFIRVENALGELTTVPQAIADFNQAFDEYNLRFRQRILLFDLIMLILALVISWWLSGKTLKPIQEVLNRQEFFAAEVSHELRTPLSTIRLEVETLLLTHKKMGSEVKYTFTSILEEVTRMSHMIQGLLLLVRAEQVDTLVQETVDINALATKVIHLTKQIAHERHIPLKLETQKTPLWVRGNTELLVQLMLILVDNAIKYSPRKGLVSLAVTNDRSGAIVRVSDTGPGIPTREREKLFVRFYRSNNTATRSTGGTGLGLVIAARICQAHGATIHVHDNPQGGSVFEVRIPLSTNT